MTQQVEVISLEGDIGLVNGKPVVHAHGVVGLEDGTTRGGHIILELIVRDLLKEPFEVNILKEVLNLES